MCRDFCEGETGEPVNVGNIHTHRHIQAWVLPQCPSWGGLARSFVNELVELVEPLKYFWIVIVLTLRLHSAI